MVALDFRDNVENEMGRIRYLLFYLLTGLAAALTHSYLNPDSALPVVGASGAISGVMGAYLLMFPTARIQMFTLLIFYPIFFEVPAVVFLLIWFLGQVAAGAGGVVNEAAGGQEVGGIAFGAHIGGFIAGMILMPFFRLGKGRRARPRRSVGWGFKRNALGSQVYTVPASHFAFIRVRFLAAFGPHL